MCEHICSRCQKQFKFPYLLKKHKERKFPCKVVELKKLKVDCFCFLTLLKKE